MNVGAPRCQNWSTVVALGAGSVVGTGSAFVGTDGFASHAHASTSAGAQRHIEAIVAFVKKCCGALRARYAGLASAT